MATKIPRIAHFAVGLEPHDEPFHLVHYLAVASCRDIVQPEEIHVHYRQLPYGFYWDLARKFVTLHHIDGEFDRLDVLAEHGGLYADIDTLFVAPPRGDMWSETCVTDRRTDGAVIMAAPGSTVGRRLPADGRVEPERTFRPFPPTADGLRRLLVTATDDLDGIVSIHLAAALWWAEDQRDLVAEVNAHTIDEKWVRAGTSTYARAAARFLPDHDFF